MRTPLQDVIKTVGANNQAPTQQKNLIKQTNKSDEGDDRTARQKMKTIKNNCKTDKKGNMIGDGSWHVLYAVREFPEYPQISARVEESETTESVYVKYFNKENGKSVRVRYSSHENNAVKFGDELDGHVASDDEILFHLGLRVRTFVPLRKKVVPTHQVAKKNLSKYEECEKTIQGLYDLPVGASLENYIGKLAKGSNYLIDGEKVVDFIVTRKNIFGNTVEVGDYIYSKLDD